jgi:serine/threonine protein kinase
MVVIPFL